MLYGELPPALCQLSVADIGWQATHIIKKNVMMFFHPLGEFL